MKISYLIYEDNDDFRNSLVAVLDEDPELLCCGAFPNPMRIMELVEMYEPDIILMDIEMPGKNGIDALAEVKAQFPKVQVMMLTVFDDNASVFNAVCAGASGYLLKSTSPDEIARAMKETANGGAPMTGTIAKKILQSFTRASLSEVHLTEQEYRILKLLVDGHSYKMIASEMNIVLDTVRYHIKKIYDKLHVHSAPEAVAKAIRDRLVQ